MVLYRYHARTASGENQEGTFEAADLRSAMQALLMQDLQVISLAKVPPESKGWGRKIDETELSQVSRKLASLTEMGAPLAHSLTVLTAEMRNPHLREVLKEIRVDLENGRPLAESMRKHPDVFSSFHVSMIEAGEHSGTLSHMLYRMADLWQKQAHLRARLRGLMIYPSCIFAVIFVFAAIFRLWLWPKLVALYPSEELPLAMHIYRACLDFCLWGAPIILVAFFFIWAMSKRSAALRLLLARLQFALPFSRDLAREIVAARFSRTFGMLLRGGVDPTDAIRLSSKVVGNILAERELEAAAELVGSGRSIADALEATNVVPRDLVLSVSLSEDRGSISQDLLEVADNHEQSVDIRINAMLSVLEPGILVALSLFVGLCALSGWWPYIQMASSVGPGGGFR